MPPRKTAGNSTHSRQSLRLKRNGPLLDLPLDIFMEYIQILKIVHPLDLLYLSRTNKALRKFLLARSSAKFIWRTSLESAKERPPKCPSYTDEVQWTRLLFEEVCHVCGTPLEHDYSFDPIWWEFGARYCSECCTAPTRSRLVVKSLPRKLTKGCVGGTKVRWADIFPRVIGYYLVKDIKSFVAKYSTSVTEAEKTTLIQERRNQTKVINDHATICRIWMSRIVKARELEREQLNDARWAAIEAKVREAGWNRSRFSGYVRSQRWDSHGNDRAQGSQPLTDTEWNKIGPQFLKDLEDRVKGTVMRGRFDALSTAFGMQLTAVTQSLAFPPRMVDVALLPEVRAILEGDLKSEITANGLKAALQSKLPDLLAAWSDAFQTQLRDRTRAALKLPPDVDPFGYARAYFVSEYGAGSGERWKLTRTRAASALRQNPFTLKGMFGLELGRTVLPDVIKRYWKTPRTATCEEMDAAPGKLWCMRCELQNQPTGWRDAVRFDVFLHVVAKTFPGMVYKTHSTEVKHLALRALEEGMSMPEVENLFGVNHRSIPRWDKQLTTTFTLA
ncbi:hypothetical protein GGX14DRAFT_662515 [Mycena pura]|uniref:F-box domain-containing protein n=1 Tax=Mycena pura TaxID=153505 RepID=A0AAD6V0N9_9AGAR|nr:hypothetical protein GGX14DRAFT_662515 [Mycena pura]